jgi:putative membrane protein insertion efficiency factor
MKLNNLFSFLYVLFIKVYKKTLSPIIAKRFRCRFYPTCSQYSKIAVEKHGIINGLKLTIKRLKRCRPDNYESVIDFPPNR